MTQQQAELGKAEWEQQTEQRAALAKLLEPFPKESISLLPKPYKKDSPKGKCDICGGYHGLPAMHLDYVGHAALTYRLLQVDPLWTWEPLAFNEKGLPATDDIGGLWIKLTVCGVTRLGYGAADAGKDGPNAVKEAIGDALRNAAMRFGAALNLWHKGDLFEAAEAQGNVNESTEYQINHAAAKTITPTTGSWDAMSDEEKEFLQGIALEVVALVVDGKPGEAAAYIAEQNLDADEKVALWSRLDSKTRSAMKKTQEAKAI